MGTVLASVSDKTGLADFAKRLKKAGFDFLASGGTAEVLRNEGINVTEISEHISYPEILGGRVKTLHPIIYGGILARQTKKDLTEINELHIKAIDIVIVNLYPFEKTITNPAASEADCIENIDIGGVSLLRAAAKNYERVTVICETCDYETAAYEIEKNGSVSLKTRMRFALKAFDMCTGYDAAITLWMKNNIGAEETKMPEKLCTYVAGFAGRHLRYGENPHQKALLYNTSPGADALGGTVLQGKELSYNNILDADAAWQAVSLFTHPAAVVVKHLTPCGAAELNEETELHTALEAAVACDPVSAYGGILAVNRTFDKNCFTAIENMFIECIIAPHFAENVKPLLAKKKNIRLIEAPLSALNKKYEFKSVLGGFLVQEKDSGEPAHTEYKNAAERKVDAAEEKLLRFAMKVCIAVKSNAIVLAAPIICGKTEKGCCTVGIGCGQPNRVDAARQAIARAGEKAKDAVLASDAFFPFEDTVKVAAAAGISAIIQPGGSIRDGASIAECNKNNMAMLITGVRHFKH